MIITCILQVKLVVSDMKETRHRSTCSIAFGLDILGDKWSLIIVRDLALRGKSSYGDFLKSEEKIATNILASRLLLLENNGIIRKSVDFADRRKERYALTEKGIALLPVLLELLIWGSAYFTESESPKWLVAEAKKDRDALVKVIESNIGEGKALLPAS